MGRHEPVREPDRLEAAGLPVGAGPCVRRLLRQAVPEQSRDGRVPRQGPRLRHLRRGAGLRHRVRHRYRSRRRSPASRPPPHARHPGAQRVLDAADAHCGGRRHRGRDERRLFRGERRLLAGPLLGPRTASAVRVQGLLRPRSPAVDRPLPRDLPLARFHREPPGKRDDRRDVWRLDLGRGAASGERSVSVDLGGHGRHRADDRGRAVPERERRAVRQRRRARWSRHGGERVRPVVLRRLRPGRDDALHGAERGADLRRRQHRLLARPRRRWKAR